MPEQEEYEMDPGAESGVMDPNTAIIPGEPVKTIGISPKVWVPFATLATAILCHWIGTGEFDRAETSASLMTALYAAIAYFSSPGKVERAD